MSKSYGNTIDIFGDEKEMRKRVMSIVTDSTPVEAPKNPDRFDDPSALLAVRFRRAEIEEMRERFQKRRHRLRRFQETTVR